MRTRTIYLHRLAACPPSSAIEWIASFLEQQPRISVRTAGGLSTHTQFSSRTVEDYTDTVRRQDALEFSWSAPRPWLPPLQAVLTVRPHAPPGCELQLSIAYAPPFGLLGGIFDALLGKRLAYATASALLDDAAAVIEDRWAAMRREAEAKAVV
jgi:hypothetical protein